MMKAKDSWPPNGGKVTLVLRNVLSECFSETEQKEVSFAYRELSEERFERVKNAIGKFSFWLADGRSRGFGFYSVTVQTAVSA